MTSAHCSTRWGTKLRPTTITAYLDTPVVGRIGPLDGPLAWAAAQEALRDGTPLEEITDDYAPDMDLPLGKWEKDGFWGWRVSNPITDPAHHTSVEIRRRPAGGPMSYYTTDREHHTGLGPLKARNVTLAATWYNTIHWHADVTDRDTLRRLLTLVTHLGARHRNGFGQVTSWEITDGPADGWCNRPLPSDAGTMQRVRAPYWHSTERTICA